jgi:hypothetical protein
MRSLLSENIDTQIRGMLLVTMLILGEKGAQGLFTNKEKMLMQLHEEVYSQ